MKPSLVRLKSRTVAQNFSALEADSRHAARGGNCRKNIATQVQEYSKTVKTDSLFWLTCVIRRWGVEFLGMNSAHPA